MEDKDFWQICYMICLFNGKHPNEASREADQSVDGFKARWDDVDHEDLDDDQFLERVRWALGEIEEED